MKQGIYITDFMPYMSCLAISFLLSAVSSMASALAGSVMIIVLMLSRVYMLSLTYELLLCPSCPHDTKKVQAAIWHTVISMARSVFFIILVCHCLLWCKFPNKYLTMQAVAITFIVSYPLLSILGNIKKPIFAYITVIIVMMIQNCSYLLHISMAVS